MSGWKRSLLFVLILVVLVALLFMLQERPSRFDELRALVAECEDALERAYWNGIIAALEESYNRVAEHILPENILEASYLGFRDSLIRRAAEKASLNPPRNNRAPPKRRGGCPPACAGHNQAPS